MKRLVIVLGLAIGLSLTPALHAFADDTPNPPTPGAPTGASSAPAPTGANRSTAEPKATLACNNQEFCVSQGINFEGNTWKFTIANSNWGFVSWASLYHEDSSWRSRWDVPVIVYKATGYGGGASLCVDPGWNVYYNNAANDKGASHKWDGRGQCG